MSGIKIVINPISGRLDRVELRGAHGDTEGQKYLFSVYLALAEDIRQLINKTSSKVQIDRALGKLGEPSLALKSDYDLSVDVVEG